MRNGIALGMVLVVVAVGAGCGDRSDRESGATTAANSTASSVRTTARAPANTTTAPTPESVQDVMGLAHFAALPPGTYSIDPDLDSSTPLRVVYQIPTDGWSGWIGAAKFSDVGHVGVSITTVKNLVRHGCADHSWADPPVGHGVEDLAAALAELAPFRVTSPPDEVSIDGYRGTHLELTVPNLPVEGEGDNRYFAGCIDGKLESWVAAIDTEPGDAFYGYTGPGYVEEFWILDVEGTRLMIAAGRSPDSPPADIEQLQTILDSIQIVP